MANTSRMYVVVETSGTKHLIDAANAARARRHVADKLIASCEPANGKDVAAMMEAGIRPQVAGAE